MKKFASVGVGPGFTGGNCAFAAEPNANSSEIAADQNSSCCSLDCTHGITPSLLASLLRIGRRAFAGPDEPRKIFFPSGNVMSRPLARCDPSLAWKPSKMTSVPMGMELLVKPWRMSAFGEPPSIIHSVVVPSSVLHGDVKPGVRIDHLNLHHGASQFNGLVGVEFGGESVMGEQREVPKPALQ